MTTFISAWLLFLIGLIIAWFVWGNNSSDNA